MFRLRIGIHLAIALCSWVRWFMIKFNSSESKDPTYERLAVSRGVSGVSANLPNASWTSTRLAA